MQPKKLLSFHAFAILALVIAFIALPFIAPQSASGFELAGAMGALGLGMAFLVQDAEFIETKALPNGAASVTSDAFDLGHGTRGDVLADLELKITAPALVVGDLADAATMTYIVEHDDAVGFGTVSTLIDRAIVQTGAGGVGAAAATKTVRLPVDCKRYVRVKATNSGAGDASDKSMTVELLF